MIPLLPSVDRASWSDLPSYGTERDHSLEGVRDKVLTRDNYTCQGCNWRSKRWQEILHLNGHHSDNRLKNLATLCPLCAQTFHLPTVALSKGATLIWLPEMSQAELNRILIAIFVVLKSGSAYQASAKALFNALNSRNGSLESLGIRQDSDTQVSMAPLALLAQVLLRMQPKDYAQRSKTLGSLRLLALPSRFPEPIDYWAKHYFAKLEDMFSKLPDYSLSDGTKSQESVTG